MLPDVGPAFGEMPVRPNVAVAPDGDEGAVGVRSQ